MSLLGDIFNVFLINPLTNLFILLATVTGSAGIAVILLTVIIRLATYPLQQKQMHSTRMMSALQPRMQEIQRKYKDPKRRSEEQMKLYKEAGFNPLGCFSSMMIQFPILWALYRTFEYSVGEPPESLVRLSDRIYGWDFLRSGLPLKSDFLWMHLGSPDLIILPITVAATTYVLQKMSTMPAMDEKARAQASMMNFLMPLFFGYITINLPSGLALYYVLSNIIGMFMQYVYVGGGPFNWRSVVGLSQEPVLPRAMDVRRAQLDVFKSDDEEEDADGVGVGKPGPKPSPSSNGRRSETSSNDTSSKRRRRRYARGKR
ncbi:MAG TPA: YidC/Oxa1 family membrane protein insertase [Dehalococcoidia bacterium]|nr:YidC/Oxa1 family membrane protein insertase [Dehalococcoidia bacterium]